MKITPASTKTVLEELAAWCSLAQEALASTTQPLQSTGLRALKNHLLRQHSLHLAQLKDLLGDSPRRTFASRQRMAWSQVIDAMESRDEHVALTACALLERAVLAAYAKAADHIWLDHRAMRLVRRHRIELKCCWDHYLRPVQCWEESHARPADTRAALGGLAAAIS